MNHIGRSVARCGPVQLASVLAALATLTSTAPVLAAPVEGYVNIGLLPTYFYSGPPWHVSLNLGIGAELGLQGSPWRFGGLACSGSSIAQFSGILPPQHLSADLLSPQSFSLWARYAVRLDDHNSVSWLAGANRYTEPDWAVPAIVGASRPSAAQPYGAIVGAQYEFRWHWLRIRLTPNTTLLSTVSNPDSNDWPELRSGIPWLEVGARVLPHLELSVGACATPVKAAWIL